MNKIVILAKNIKPEHTKLIKDCEKEDNFILVAIGSYVSYEFKINKELFEILKQNYKHLKIEDKNEDNN